MNIKKRGFSLFELLVTISIIGILVAIVSISYSSAQKKARDARIIQDLGMIQKAAEQYYGSNGYSYPSNLSDWSVGTSWPGVLDYLPADPKTTPYYPSNIGTSSYCLCSFGVLEGTKGNASDNQCGGFGKETADAHYCIKNQQ